jgi:PAS domain S-box-containing protein
MIGESPIRIENHIASFLKDLPVSLNALDLKGTFTYWGKASERIFGYEEPEIVGIRTLANLHGAAYDLEEELAECEEKGRLSRECIMLRKDGSSIHVQKTLIPLKSPQGEMLGYACYMEDLTRQIEAREKFLEEKQKVDGILRAVGTGIMVIARDLSILWHNRLIEEWFGSPEEMPVKTCYYLLEKDEHGCVECPGGHVFEDGKIRVRDRSLFNREGKLRNYHLTYSPILNEKGEVVQVVMLVQDITERAKKIYQFFILRHISQIMQETLELKVLLYVILSSITAGFALGFNRAFLFLLDKSKKFLVGKIGVGPASEEEASRLWFQVAREARTIDKVIERYEVLHTKEGSSLDRLVKELRFPVEGEPGILVSALRNRKTIFIKNAEQDPRVSEELRNFIKSSEFVVAPLITKKKVLGVIVADNLYSFQPITEDDVEMLSMLASQAGLAIENAKILRQAREKAKRLKNAMKRLKETQNLLIRSEKLAAIGQVATHLAHEIRNPLITIGGFARAALKKLEDSEGTEAKLAIIVDEVTRLEHILASVVDFLQPLKPSLAPYSLSDILDEAIKIEQDELRDKKLKLSVDYAYNGILLLDRNQIIRVLFNLLENAIDALEEGGRLEIRTRKEGDFAVIEIQDYGTGISPSQLQHLFEPFFTTKKKGTGLGLAISENIVREHGGRIDVHSRRGKGTTISVYLPVEMKKVEEEQARQLKFSWD